VESRRPQQPAAGTRQQRSPWYPAFLAAVLTVVVAVGVLVIVVANISGGGGGGGPALAVSGTATQLVGGQPTSPAATPGATTAAVKPSAAAEPTAAGSAAQVVKCHDLLAPVDKNHRLPEDCVPSNLVTLPASISADGTQQLTGDAASAMEEMFAAAKTAGFTLYVNSSYRSYADQVSTYNYWVQTDGQEYADRTSARPGFSEHQMGTAADIGTEGHVLEDFIGTPAAAWVAANSWKYGFIVSYPDGKEAITGYAPEPWHVRWIGKDVAQQVHASGLTLHEFLLK